MSQSVFVSHSKRDLEWARAFSERLSKVGIEVWTSQEGTEQNEPLADKAENALRRSDSLILILRPENLNSPYVHFEVGAAIAKGSKLIAILDDDVSIDQLPLNIKRMKFYSMNSPEETARQVEVSLVAAN